MPACESPSFPRKLIGCHITNYSCSAAALSTGFRPEQRWVAMTVPEMRRINVDSGIFLAVANILSCLLPSAPDLNSLTAQIVSWPGTNCHRIYFCCLFLYNKKWTAYKKLCHIAQHEISFYCVKMLLSDPMVTQHNTDCYSWRQQL